MEPCVIVALPQDVSMVIFSVASEDEEATGVTVFGERTTKMQV
jgi:hypothetical protein